jgi:peptidoglycan hydrolase-like protein with peptidoglycan-binding domain
MNSTKIATALALASWLIIGGTALADGTNHEEAGEPSSARDAQQEQTDETASRVSELRAESISIAELDAEEVRKLQTALKEEGYNQGEIDGQVGRHTRQALRQYYSDHAQLALRGLIRTEAAESLGVDTSDVQPVGGRDEATRRESLRGQEARKQDMQSDGSRPGGVSP